MNGIALKLAGGAFFCLLGFFGVSLMHEAALDARDEEAEEAARLRRVLMERDEAHAAAIARLSGEVNAAGEDEG